MWYRQKTTWTGIAGVIAAVGGVMTGTLSPVEAVQIGLTSLIGIFLRQGISKAE